MGNLIKKREEALIKAGRTVDDKGKIDVTKLDDQTIKRCRDITKGITNSDSLKKFGSDIVSTSRDCISNLIRTE